MTPTLLVIAYGITIIASAMVGGYLPQVMRMNHVRMQVILSFVGGMMLGVAILQLLPHAFLEVHAHVAAQKADEVSFGSKLIVGRTVELTMRATLVGLLVTFFMMRAFHFHQHGDLEESASTAGSCRDHDHTSHGHSHDAEPFERPRTRLGWLGLIFGLGLHTFMDGIALGAIVVHDMSSHASKWTPAGFGVYLAILLHKPLDALSVSTLMAAENRSWTSIQAANACFGLMCLFGALFAVYFGPLASGGLWLGCMLAAAAGVFLCISLSDLLPEVQFHRHDRMQLSGALLLGIGIACVIELLHPHFS